MEQLIELLQQIQELAGAGIDALKEAAGGAEKGAPEEAPRGAPKEAAPGSKGSEKRAP